MENEIKVPVIILTRDLTDGNELARFLHARYPDRNLQVHVVSTPEQMVEHLTVKHYNIVIVDYDRELYQKAEDLVYNKPGKMAASLTLSSYYDVQFIFRKPGDRQAETIIINKPGVTEMVVEDHKDYESIASLVDELLVQQVARKRYRIENVAVAAVLVVFFLIIAIIIF